MKKTKALWGTVGAVGTLLTHAAATLFYVVVHRMHDDRQLGLATQVAQRFADLEAETLRTGGTDYAVYEGTVCADTIRAARQRDEDKVAVSRPEAVVAVTRLRLGPDAECSAVTTVATAKGSDGVLRDSAIDFDLINNDGRWLVCD